MSHQDTRVTSGHCASHQGQQHLCKSTTTDDRHALCPECHTHSLASEKNVVIGTVKYLSITAASGNRKEKVLGLPDCHVHMKHSVEFLCLKCDIQVCLLCKSAEHEGHPSRSLALLASEARQRVEAASEGRLAEFESRLLLEAKRSQQRRETLRRMRQDVEDSVTQRHAQLVKVLDEHRDSALLELEAMAVEAEASMREDEDRLTEERGALAQLRQRAQDSVKDTDPTTLLQMDRNLESAWSSEQIMNRRSKTLPAHAFELKHKYASSAVSFKFQGSGINTLRALVSAFIGRPIKTKRPLLKASSNVRVKAEFSCCDDPCAIVVAVCPIGGQKVAVSHFTSNEHEEGVTRSFFEDGRPSKSFDFGLGILMETEDEKFVFYSSKTRLSLFGMQYHFKALFSKAGKLDIFGSTDGIEWCHFSLFVWSPLNFLGIKFFFPKFTKHSISGVAPLAFDTTENGNVIAIVDAATGEAFPFFDNNLGKLGRVVRVVTFGDEHALHYQYQPPTPDFAPSDVCFFTLRGQMVLLISDMATSSIHVAAIEPLSKTFQFQRYLVADCESMQQPTALNIDNRGRLWVACKGGQLITVTEQSDTDAN